LLSFKKERKKDNKLILKYKVFKVVFIVFLSIILFFLFIFFSFKNLFYYKKSIS